MPISSEHTVMPDDELGIAGHIYRLDYEPGAPETILNKHQLIEDNLIEARKRTSLMELAGLDTDEDKFDGRTRRPRRAPTGFRRPTVDEAEFDDALPEHVKTSPAPKPSVEGGDDDFLKLIEEETRESGPK
jgi:hypothetical protein